MSKTNMKNLNMISVIKKLISEQSEEEYVISPEEYKDWLKKVANQAQAIPKLPKFRGKKLVVKGKLDLKNNDKITDLGNIKVDGNLDVSNTNVKSLDNVVVTGHKSFWNTPYAQILEKRRMAKIRSEADDRREDDEWNLENTDTEGEMAHAAFRYAVNEGDLDELTDEELERVNEINQELRTLKSDEEISEEVQERIEELEEELDDLMDGKDDVYVLYPSGRHYDLHIFSVLRWNMEYAVGTSDEADSSLEEYYDNMIDDADSYFSRDHLESYVDGDKVAEYFEDSIRDEFSDDDILDDYNVSRELSRGQEEEIWLLEMEKWAYENEGVRAPISEPSREEGNIFDFEDVEGNRFQYKNTSTDPNRSNWVLYKNGQVVSPHQIYDDEDTEEHEDERESRISDIESEIEEIKDNPEGDFDEDEIQRLIDDRMDEIRHDPVGHLDDYGYDVSNFIDLDELKRDLINEASYGYISGYNDSYDEINVNGTYYVVMRIN